MAKLLILLKLWSVQRLLSNTSQNSWETKAGQTASPVNNSKDAEYIKAMIINLISSWISKLCKNDPLILVNGWTMLVTIISMCITFMEGMMIDISFIWAMNKCCSLESNDNWYC